MADPNEQTGTEPGEVPPTEEPPAGSENPVLSNEENTEEGDRNKDQGNDEKRPTENKNHEREKERTMSENAFNEQKPDKDQGYEGVDPDANDQKDNGDEDESGGSSNLSYGVQIFRAIVFFVVGCTIVSDLTGVALWRCLEYRNH